MHRSKPAGGLVLVAKTLRAADRPEVDVEMKPVAPQEIVLDGRKYLLVPVEEDAAAKAAPPSPPSRPPPRVPTPELLTARELQVVALVAEGRANKQIAAELSISEWTVSSHLRRIYAKLDVDTRAAMVNRCYGGQAVRGSSADS
jgi:DNA-binding NarL/FixJ family response regulator